MSSTPVPADPRRELTLLLASRIALIAIESREESRVLELVRAAGLAARRGREWGVFQWTVTEGLRRTDIDAAPQRLLADPVQLLRHLKATPMPGIYVLLDFHPYLDEPVNVRMLKDIAQGYAQVARTIVLVSYEVTLPVELAGLAARLRLAPPQLDERRRLVQHVAAEWTAAHPGRAAQCEPQLLERLADNLSGLTAADVERLARRAIFDDGALRASDLQRILAEKYQLLSQGGALTYEPDSAPFSEVGGMQHLRHWLQSRRAAFDGSAPELDAPKGILLLGVQGCGKSLAARAAAGVFGVPLVRLDVGALYSKWHGESEKNLRESLEAAEALAPCVLWIDEMEKALAEDEADGGTARRVLGTFLTWLAEPHGRVFIVATANDITALPPELIRKGRLDEIFFVDLPDEAVRAAILAIHARKRSIRLTPQEALSLARHCEGFSGAELEQAVVAALYSAHANGQAVSAAALAQELAATRPLSVVMAERIAALRAWARERTVPAD
jgi:hypothetical protein